MDFFTSKMEPPCKALEVAPPGTIPCHPTLILGLPEFASSQLDQVLINDLVFSSTTRFRLPKIENPQLKLAILNFLDGKSLLHLTQVCGGSVILPEDEVFAEGTDQVDIPRLKQLSQRRYQAIVVDDTCFIREPDITEFVSSQYHKEGVSVVIMALEDIFDLSCLQKAFHVDWRLRAYTKRTIKLSNSGQKIIGETAFPFRENYVKSHFVSSGQPEREELFLEHINPDDYEVDSDDSYDDPVPEPGPGSPVVTHIVGNKSVSYFGFANSLDVSYGAIILRLCYAAYHSDGTSFVSENYGSAHVSKSDYKIAYHSDGTALVSDNYGSAHVSESDGKISYWEQYRSIIAGVTGKLAQIVLGAKPKKD